MTNTNFFSNMICMNDPINISKFEKEIGKHILSMSDMAENSHDIEQLIVDALKRRCNERKTLMHAHLRLKHGASTNECTMTWNELAELTEMISLKGAANEIIKRLANFYVRIASLHNRIEHVRRCLSSKKINENQCMHETSNYKLLTAYSKNEENMREKRNQNNRELDQVLKTLFLDSEIHPELTENDLSALETQVEHIAQRGCSMQELRRLKIMEALLEDKTYNELVKELKTLTN